MEGRPILSVDRVTALVLIICFAAYGLEGYSFKSTLGVDVVGPGFFPMSIAVLGLIMSAIMLVSPSTPPKTNGLSNRAHLRAVVPVLVMLAYVLLMHLIGFGIATVIFLTVMIRYFGAPSWLYSFGFALGGAAVTIATFVYGLDVRVPHGLLSKFW